MKATATIYVERGEDEIELEVRGTVHPIVRAKRWGHPDTWSPEEGGEIELEQTLAVTLTGARAPWDGELTDAEQERAEEALAEAAAEDDSDDCYEDRDDLEGDR